MTEVRFLTDPVLCGFIIKGHSTENCDDEEGRLVCAAVSSAAYMVANTITEIIGDRADITVNEAEMRLSVTDPSKTTMQVLEGMRLHMKELSGQYSKNIRVFGGAKPC